MPQQSKLCAIQVYPLHLISIIYTNPLPIHKFIFPPTPCLSQPFQSQRVSNVDYVDMIRKFIHKWTPRVFKYPLYANRTVSLPCQGARDLGSLVLAIFIIVSENEPARKGYGSFRWADFSLRRTQAPLISVLISFKLVCKALSVVIRAARKSFVKKVQVRPTLSTCWVRFYNMLLPIFKWSQIGGIYNHGFDALFE